jgi:hypothetical protein
MITRPITRSITRAITRSIAGVETIVFIELEAAASAYYSLSTPWVAAGGFRIPFHFQTTMSSGLGVLLGNSSTSANFVLMDGATGKIRTNVPPQVGAVYSSGSFNDGKLHYGLLVKSGTTLTTYIDGVAELVRTGATDPVIFDMFGGNAFGNYFDGILSNPKLTDISTPANSLAFTLGELTANSEVNNGVTLTYNNIATTQDVRDTYTLSNNDTQWVGALQTIDIAQAPTALFNSSGVLTCSGTLDCASTIPCGA